MILPGIDFGNCFDLLDFSVRHDRASYPKRKAKLQNDPTFINVDIYKSQAKINLLR